jgi:uncharacterized membrane protein YqjE
MLGEYTYPSSSVQNMRPSRDRSTADVLKDIFATVQEIIRSEVRLVKVEIREDAAGAMRAAKLLAIGAVIGLYAAGFVLLGLVYLLTLIVPAWGAALIVGLVLSAVAAVMVSKGRERLKHLNAKPEKAIENVKENVAWIKDQTKS